MLAINDDRILFTIHLNSMLQKPDRQLTDRFHAFSIRDNLKNEGVRLDSEIAVAILARKEETRQLKELKEVVLRVHTVLQKLTAQCRDQDRSLHLAKGKAV